MFSFKIYADAATGFGMHRFVQLASAFTTVYYYEFDYAPRFSHVYYPDDKPFGENNESQICFQFFI